MVSIGKKRLIEKIDERDIIGKFLAYIQLPEEQIIENLALNWFAANNTNDL